MGILNVTPDSFSDGGSYATPEAAAERAFAMVREGASIVDVGGESTRPGAAPVPWQEEWRRIAPVLEILRDGGIGAATSVDTYHPETARKAAGLGVSILNCVSEAAAPEILEIAREAGVETVLPAKCLGGCIGEDDLSRVYLDPMVGFGTTREEDLALLRSVGELARKGRVLVGASRKRIVRALAGEERTDSLLGGDVAIALWAAENGAAAVRVHDVAEVAQALRVREALEKGRMM